MNNYQLKIVKPKSLTDKLYFQAWLDKICIGHIVCELHYGGKTDHFHLDLLFVKPSFRNKGVGNFLMKNFILNAPKLGQEYFINYATLYAESLSENISQKLLIEFYKKFGFKNIPKYKKNFLMYSWN